MQHIQGGSQETCKGGRDAKELSPWIDSQPVEGRAHELTVIYFSAARTLGTVAKARMKLFCI